MPRETCFVKHVRSYWRMYLPGRLGSSFPLFQKLANKIERCKRECVTIRQANGRNTVNGVASSQLRAKKRKLNSLTTLSPYILEGETRSTDSIRLNATIPFASVFFHFQSQSIFRKATATDSFQLFRVIQLMMKTKTRVEKKKKKLEIDPFSIHQSN